MDGDVVLAEQLWTRVLAVSPADSRVLKALRRIWSQPPPAPSPSSPSPSSPSGRRTGEAPTPSAPTVSFE
ncbi:MAG: peptidase C14, partial [Cyanothece sp. SIO2G6]|nr:peptidase C14 [Cyanothece sp. SIO2G6]